MSMCVCVCVRSFGQGSSLELGRCRFLSRCRLLFFGRFFGRRFVKQFALCYLTVVHVCPVCPSGFHQNYLLFKGYKVSYNQKCPYFRSNFEILNSTLKIGEGALPPFGGMGLGLHLTQSRLPPCQVPASSIQPFGRNKRGPKIFGEALRPLLGGKTGSPSNTKSPGPRPTSIPSDILIHAAIWPQQIWAENWCPFRGGGAGSPPNTVWPGPRPICVPSFILIRPTVWPQCTNVTDRQTDRQTEQDKQRTDSIRRTVLQTVAQNDHYLKRCST